MKRWMFYISALISIAGIVTTQNVAYGLDEDLSMDEAVVAAVEKDHRSKIWELRIEDARDQYEDALEDHDDAINRTYANEERLSAISIQNKKEIYLLPLMNWYGLVGHETSLLVQEEQTEDDAQQAWINFYIAQKEQEFAREELRLAQMELEAFKSREQAGTLVTSQVNDKALHVLKQELMVQEKRQQVELAAKKLSYWTGLEVNAEADLCEPEVKQIAFLMPDPEEYVQNNLIVSDAVWQAVYDYETTVLNLQAIEDGFRGPNFKENQPDAYQEHVIDQLEKAFNLEVALVSGEESLLATINNLENQSVNAINQKKNRGNREKEWAAAQIRYNAGGLSILEYETTKLNLAKAELMELEAVFAWNQTVNRFYRQQKTSFTRKESMKTDWLEEMKQQVAAWKYDPKTVYAESDEAYIDWILTKNRISTTFRDEE